MGLALPVQAQFFFKGILGSRGRSLLSTGSTFNRGDFTATNAFLWSSLDLSPYHGTDLGSTPFYIEVLDGTGKKATGYLGAVGAGETLGSEILANTEFENTTNVYSAGGTFASIVGGQAGNCLEFTAGSQYDRSIEWLPMTQHALYKASAYHKAGTGGNAASYLVICKSNLDIYGLINITLSDSWVQHIVYANAKETLVGTSQEGEIWFFGGAGLTSTKTYLIDTASTKQVTDPPATAVHIVSSLNGTVRNWASIESGFNPETIASWKITSVGTATINW